jgi:hypothetical protein
MKFSLWVMILLPLVSVAQTNNPSSNSLDQLMTQWLDIESQKGRMQSEWSLRKAELTRRLSLLDIERDALNDVIAQGNKVTSDVDQRRLSLLKVQDELEVEQTRTDAQLKQVVQTIQTLNPKLPPPLQDQWNEKLPLLLQGGSGNSEKLERLLSMFLLVNEFDKRIAIHRSTMSIANADDQQQALLVTQIYLGASQGWYVSDDGSAYGYGRATSLGWHWWHGEEASTELGRELDPKTLLKVRAILENPTTATFVSLPIKI